MAFNKPKWWQVQASSVDASIKALQELHPQATFDRLETGNGVCGVYITWPDGTKTRIDIFATNYTG